jgi:hypothetical protein
MNEAMTEMVIDALNVQPPQTVTQYSESNIIFGPDYPTLYKGKYDSTLFPYWNEIMESVADPEIQTICVQKSSQTRGSQAMISALHYTMGVFSAPCMFVAGSKEMATSFLEERVIPILRSSLATGDWMKSAESREKNTQGRKRGQMVQLPNGSSLVSVNAGSTSDSKSRPARFLYLDEVDSYAGTNVVDKFESRMATYKDVNCCMLMISTPDVSIRKTKKSGESPIQVEMEKTDKRRWHLYDPKTKETFFLEWGMKDKDNGDKVPDHGVKWSPDAKNEDGTYDLNLMRDTAHYVSPEGTKYTQRELDSLILKGSWIPTNDKQYDRKRRGYYISSIYTRPMEDLCVEFILAKTAGFQKLKTWISEALGSICYDSYREVAESALSKLERDYEKGHSYFEMQDYLDEQTQKEKENPLYKRPEIKRIMGIDVQRNNLWWGICDIAVGGKEMCIVNYGSAITFDDCNTIADKYNTSYIVVDSNFSERKTETYEACKRYNFLPVYGHGGQSTSLEWQQFYRDPFLGTSKQGTNSLIEYAINADTQKHHLTDMYEGESPTSLYMYRASERQLTQQMTAEKYVDKEWKKKRQDNHLFDVWGYCLVRMKIAGLFSMMNQ